MRGGVEVTWKTAKIIGGAVVGVAAAYAGGKLFGREAGTIILTGLLGVGAHELFDAPVSKEIYKLAN
jgi:hypothetical protein